MKKREKKQNERERGLARHRAGVAVSHLGRPRLVTGSSPNPTSLEMRSLEGHSCG